MDELPDWIRSDQQRNRQRILARRSPHVEFYRAVVIVAIAGMAILAVVLQPYTLHYERTEEPAAPTIEIQSAYASEKTYHVTGYNTVPEQTDSTPCIAASGADICGRTDVVACPRALALGTEVEIDGKVYVCEDRLALKYDHRIDVSCDKNTKCPAAVSGYKVVKILK